MKLTQSQQKDLIEACIGYYEDDIEISELGDNVLAIINDEKEN